MISIRPAREADFPALDRLWLQLAQKHQAAHPHFFRTTERTTCDYRRRLHDPDRQLFVAVVADAVAGVVSVQVSDTPNTPGLVKQRRAYIDEIIVDIAHRQCGIGRQLMRAASEWAKCNGAADLLLTLWEGNDSAMAFYERLGYRQLSRVLTHRL